MKLAARLRDAEQAANRLVRASPSTSVFDRIDELTALFSEHPPTFSPEVEAGILAAVERDELAASSQRF